MKRRNDMFQQSLWVFLCDRLWKNDHFVLFYLFTFAPCGFSCFQSCHICSVDHVTLFFPCFLDLFLHLKKKKSFHFLVTQILSGIFEMLGRDFYRMLANSIPELADRDHFVHIKATLMWFHSRVNCAVTFKMSPETSGTLFKGFWQPLQ